MVPIQIRAQLLRQGQLAAQAHAAGILAVMPDEESGPSAGPGAQRKAPWRQADVKRAIGAAEQAGLQSYRVEIAPDGTIAIIVGEPSQTAADPDSYSDLLGS